MDLSEDKGRFYGILVVAFLICLQGQHAFPLFLIRMDIIEAQSLKGRKSSEFEPKELYWSTIAMNTMALLGLICMTLFVYRL